MACLPFFEASYSYFPPSHSDIYLNLNLYEKYKNVRYLVDFKIDI